MSRPKTIVLLLSILFLLCILFLAFIHIYRYQKIKRLQYDSSIKHSSIPPKKIIPNGKIQIVLFGDSRIKSWGAETFSNDFQIINIGFSGLTTAEALNFLNDDVLDLKPDWYIIQLGINDIVAESMLPPKRRAEA